MLREPGGQPEFPASLVEGGKLNDAGRYVTVSTAAWQARSGGEVKEIVALSFLQMASLLSVARRRDTLVARVVVREGPVGAHLPGDTPA